MLPYQYILKFDDDAHTMREGDGIPLEQVADLLSSLLKALKPSKDERIILYDVIHASYGLALSTNSNSIQNHLELIHSKVSRQDYEGLNSDETAYIVKLRKVLGGRFYVQAFDPQKDDKVEVREIQLPEPPKYYFETGSVYGTVTAIGSTNLEGTKSYIRITGITYQIEVTEEQESQLVHHFKKNKLRFSIVKRIDFSSGEVKSARLEDFKTLSDQSFTQLAEALSKEHPNGLFNEIEDTPGFIRHLRTAIPS